jgi:parallel beta-helix repeat protein
MHKTKVGEYAGLAAAAVFAVCSAGRADIIDTIQAAKSGQTVNVSGTYSVNRQCNVPDGVTVTGPATFNFNNAGNGFVPGNNVRLNSLTVTGVNHPGIYIYGKSGCVINSCIAMGNKDTGIQIQASGANNNTIQYCQGKQNADSSGGNADGIDVKFGSGTGNVLKNCDAHQNSDDGYDFAGAGAPVTVNNCTAYSNGSWGGKVGNGDGFKMGLSGYPGEAHHYTGCTAHDNTAGDTGSGFDSNNNTGGCVLTQCHSYNNKQADRLQNCTLINCTMQQ